jgi:D-lactate dehydrogenase (cytochrome)
MRYSTLPIKAGVQRLGRLPSSQHARNAFFLNRKFSCSRQIREEPKGNFQGQLYESTKQRLKRERAEQERYSQYQTQSPGARYAALLFGMNVPLFRLVCFMISTDRVE